MPGLSNWEPYGIHPGWRCGAGGVGGSIRRRPCPHTVDQTSAATRVSKHAAESVSKGSRVVVIGRLQQRSWTAEDGSARSTVEVVAEELGPSLRWATATTTKATRS